MSAKTKIVVLHMKEVIYTGIFVALGILLIILLAVMFLPGKNNSETAGSDTEEQNKGENAVASSSVYIPGIYTTELILGGQTIDVEVIVEQDSISSIHMNNLSEAVTTMYPLLQPTFDSICSQIYETQSLENISYSSDSKYTSLVLLEAIQSSLDKAKPEEAATLTPETDLQSTSGEAVQSTTDDVTQSTPEDTAAVTASDITTEYTITE